MSVTSTEQLPSPPPLTRSRASGMSLFGSSPSITPAASPRPAAVGSGSRAGALFSDDLPAPPHSLFDDDNSRNEGDPWAFHTPRKSRQPILGALLTEGNANIPEQYRIAFAKLREEFPAGDGESVAVEGIEAMVKEVGGDELLEKVFSVAGRRKEAWSREEVWAVLAMCGLSAEGEDIGLDGVDDRRRDLPIPEISSLGISKTLPPQQEPHHSEVHFSYSPRGSSADSTRSIPPSTHRGENSIPSRKAGSIASSTQPAARSFQPHSLSDDPWGTSPQTRPPITLPGASSAITTGLAGTAGSPRPELLANSRPNSLPIMNPVPKAIAGFPPALEDTHEPDDIQAALALPPGAGQAPGWGGVFEDVVPPIPGGARNGVRDRISVPPSGQEESVTVTELPEMEGMFLFQHRNYQVACVRKGTRVVRRYSDFAWLLDCLHKRYPFRNLPLLPPKALTVNGIHLSSANATFLDRRRRGLVRFSNALVRHPILAQEQLVVMFFSVPTELAVWRKQANLSIVDEFFNLPLSPTLESTLPPNLPALLNTMRAGIRKSAEHYITLCNLVDRLIKRNEGLAQDYQRVAYTLAGLTDLSEATYALDPNECPLLNDGLNTASRAYTSARDLLIDESKATNEHVLEDLKALRDSFVGMRELFDRHEKLSSDARPALKKRIANNQKKLAGLQRPNPGQPPKTEEIGALRKSIDNDSQEIKRLGEREVHIKATMVEEMQTFARTVYAIGRMHQEWAQDRVKFSELVSDVWRGLVGGLEGMPV